MFLLIYLVRGTFCAGSDREIENGEPNAGGRLLRAFEGFGVEVMGILEEVMGEMCPLGSPREERNSVTHQYTTD